MAERDRYPAPYLARQAPVDLSTSLREYLTSEFKRVEKAFDEFSAQRDDGSWTPTVDFATTGDLSVAYDVQIGGFWRVQDLVMLIWRLRFTPTYTTAAGNLIINVPFEAISSRYQPVNVFMGHCQHLAGFTFPTGYTSGPYLEIDGNGSATQLLIRVNGSGVASLRLRTNELPSGTQYQFIGTVMYLTNGNRIA